MKKTDVKETTVEEPRNFYIICRQLKNGLLVQVSLPSCFEGDFLFQLHRSILQCRLPSRRGLRFFMSAKFLFDFVPPLWSAKEFLFEAFVDAYMNASVCHYASRTYGI